MTKIEEIIQEFYNKLPKFPDGRIDYHTSDVAPVLTIFVKFDGKILLLKRSDKVRAYQGKWNAIAGYLDDLKPIEEKVLEELREEIRVSQDIIEQIYYGKIEKIEDKKINKIWIGQPVLVKLKNKPKITLDFEHTDYKWILPSEMDKFDTLYHLEKTYKNLMKAI